MAPMGFEAECLELRERLKEKLREQRRKETSADLEQPQQTQKKHHHKDNYGSFFGPSVTVFPQRVNEGAKNVLETMPSLPKSKKSNFSGTNSEPTLAEDQGEPKTIARKMKENRDYSFLSSDDAPLPVSIKKEEPNASTENKAVVNINKRRVMSSLDSKKPNSSITKKPGFTPSNAKKQLIKNNPSSAVAGGGIRSSGTKLKTVKKEHLERKNDMGGGEAKSRKILISKSKESLVKQKRELKTKQYTDEEDSDVDEEEDDYDYPASTVTSVIKQLFGYDSSKFRGMRDDDRNMEASFSDIQKEERRSAKLGRKEDEIELKRIEQEEKEEKLRRAKKRKLQTKENSKD